MTMSTNVDATGPGLSNAEKGKRNFERLREYMGSVELVPDRNGKANISAIAVGSGVDRQYLYQERFQTLIAETVAAKGLGMPSQQRTSATDDVPSWALKRISDLEQQLTMVRAENAELRSQVRRLAALDQHLGATGVLPR